jgi:hypothetical protein
MQILPGGCYWRKTVTQALRLWDKGGGLWCLRDCDGPGPKEGTVALALQLRALHFQAYIL